MKKTLLIGLGLALGIAFLVYVVIGETGPVGWLNAAQLAVFGAYSRKVSMLALIVIGGMLSAPLWMIRAADTGGRALPASPPPPQSPPRSPLLWGGLAWVAMMALVWGAAYGYCWWDLRQRSADSLAEYVPVELAAGMQAPGRGREHLALRGRVLGDHVVSRSASNSSEVWQTLVPIVERGWREGDPVHFVARLDAAGERALRAATKGAGELLVRADGGVPTPALQVFAKMKAPLADDAVAVVPVATEAGRPAPVIQALDWSGAIVWAVVGSFSATLLVVFTLVALGLQGRRERKARR